MPHSNAKSTQLPIPSKSDSEFSNKLKEKIINRIKAEGDLPLLII